MEVHVDVLVGARRGRGQQPRLGRQRPFAPDAVDRAVAGGGDQPAGGIGGLAVLGPPLGGGREGLGGGLLGEVEVAEEADQRREDTAPLLTEEELEANGLVANR
jgi:hypothetical protein